MSKKRLSAIATHDVAISSFNAHFSIRAVKERGVDPEIESGPWLDLRGTLNEPIRGTQDIVISVYPREPLQIGTARPAAVGSIIHIRPRVSLVLTVSHIDFDRLWAFALAGLLKHVSFCCTEPYRNKALVPSVSFSNELIE